MIECYANTRQAPFVTYALSSVTMCGGGGGGGKDSNKFAESAIFSPYYNNTNFEVAAAS